jgi:hypothetical protein
MSFILQPWQLLFVAMSAWVNWPGDFRRGRIFGLFSWLHHPQHIVCRTMEDYEHEVSVLLGEEPEAAARLLPRVHRIASLLKRWHLGTHQGAVTPSHLDYYLDEYTFRFNRRKSRSRGKLFYRLLQQAVQVNPAPYKNVIVGKDKKPAKHNMLWVVEPTE